MEPWEKVYINLGSNDSLAELDPHLGTIACWDCHGGDPEADDKDLAHAGLIADPSAPSGTCGGCHAKITGQYGQSLHLNLWGEKAMVAGRMGKASFGDCPAEAHDGFKAECATCHATCGDCHVSRPDTSGKGFIESHVFRKKPHQLNQCMGCHGARIGHDFMGDDEAGRSPDVHFTKGKGCMSCHDGAEMHSAEPEGTDRYHASQRPTCEGCHDVAAANEYHEMHWDDLSCQVCHSLPYSNCGNCHTGKAWQTDPEYQDNNPAEDFRIGLNPLSSRRFKYATVRHIPVAPDTYDNWGIAGIATHYDEYPSWKFTTPHNIQRWTPQTSVGEGVGCGANCHLGAPDGSLDNRDLYLFKEYVEGEWPTEVKANEAVIIDGELPTSWWTE